MSVVHDTIEKRISANHFDTSRPISDEQIHELARLASLAPSAYNFQNRTLIAVRDREAKERLKAAAYGQQKVVDAAVTFIVVGTLNAHRQLPTMLKPSVDQGILTQDIFDTWVGMASGSHEGNAQLQRDEAFRSASLAGMTLMLAAEAMGLATGPMSGFDPQAVSEAFGLTANEVPVMLIAAGYAAQGNWPQKPRKPLAEFLRYA
ncbi:nitroreductase family protein [Trinickia fusca]|uniref:Nitroreductase family protein n=1 Tax=Trinickia fusca TaxID=2419777 RepID=A0A494XQT4_9BURK|nr:nitroreductase family protein [Trinickia fusca]RKP50494.1 nitroreductase family protein [Trinickia fusca]